MEAPPRPQLFLHRDDDHTFRDDVVRGAPRPARCFWARPPTAVGGRRSWSPPTPPSGRGSCTSGRRHWTSPSSPRGSVNPNGNTKVGIWATLGWGVSLLCLHHGPGAHRAGVPAALPDGRPGDAAARPAGHGGHGGLEAPPGGSRSRRPWTVHGGAPDHQASVAPGAPWRVILHALPVPLFFDAASLCAARAFSLSLSHPSTAAKHPLFASPLTFTVSKLHCFLVCVIIGNHHSPQAKTSTKHSLLCENTKLHRMYPLGNDNFFNPLPRRSLTDRWRRGWGRSKDIV